jgi:hypothetical protein
MQLHRSQEPESRSPNEDVWTDSPILYKVLLKRADIT